MYKEPVGKPHPKIFIQYRMPNGQMVKSILEFMSAVDDAKHIKNLECDIMVLDQAEMMDNLNDAVAYLGTRTRGNVKGRSRLGRLIMLANADDNVELWEQFDNAEDNPDEYLSLLVTTYSNKNLTPEQIKAFALRMGNDPEKIAQHMGAKRPMGQGFEFRRELLEGVQDKSLDDIMAAGQEKGDPEFEIGTQKKGGVVQWVMPPEAGRDYYLIADPGQGAPPGRNAPVVCVLDVTDYPKTPASLRAFWWGNGGGKYEPFVEQVKHWMAHYHCLMGGYDATGGQKVFGEATFSDLLNLLPVDLSGVKKKTFMTLLKIIMYRKYVRFPEGIKGLNNQFLKYRLPDDKLAQDIVSAFFVFAGLLWHMGLAEDLLPDEEKKAGEDEDEADVSDRHSRPVSDRYARSPARER
jgi:hypothetical protein